MFIIIVFLIVVLGICIYFCVRNISDEVKSKKEIKESLLNKDSIEFKNIFNTTVAIEFKKKYNVGLDELWFNYRSKLFSSCVYNVLDKNKINHNFSSFTLKLFDIDGKRLFVVAPHDNAYLSRAFDGATLTNELLSDIKTNLPYESIENLSKYIIKEEDLLYIEYCEKKETYTTTKSNSSVAVDAAIYGSAAAIANSSSTRTLDLSYYKFVFKNNIYPALYASCSNFDFKGEKVNLYIMSKSKEKMNKISEVEASNNNVDSLIKYKKLFDEGVITQEEFELKKKQLLDL